MRVSVDSSPTDALRGSVDSNDASSSGSASPSRAQSQRSPSIPSINIQDSDAENRCVQPMQHDKLCSISQSPVAHLGRFRNGQTANTPLFHRRLEELGVTKATEGQDSMSPEARRLAAQRFPSMERLRQSMQNLSSTEDPAKNRPVSPHLDQFKSRAPQYRSFTMKNNAAKQQDLLARLKAMRERLQEKENFQDKMSPISRHSSNSSIRSPQKT